MAAKALVCRWWLLAALGAAAIGCDGAATAPVQGWRTPPRCSAVQAFGNGARCSSDDASLSACGTAKRRTCASGWLCADAPEYIDCTCETAADCTGRTAYINSARNAAGKAPLANTCDRGRCGGRP
jgi:hypothetical protein